MIQSPRNAVEVVTITKEMLSPQSPPFSTTDGLRQTEGSDVKHKVWECRASMATPPGVINPEQFI